ncbi:hypothetical protein CASFOL_016352 [Castilleja foliolosa]|uniref:Uncharacterized protein n=1 Tax=Castilleja foliolosa TaxID=1961234 RepID=A0ABD3DHR2_9LAMI
MGWPHPSCKGMLYMTKLDNFIRGLIKGPISFFLSLYVIFYILVDDLIQVKSNNTKNLSFLQGTHKLLPIAICNILYSGRRFEKSFDNKDSYFTIIFNDPENWLNLRGTIG